MPNSEALMNNAYHNNGPLGDTQRRDKENACADPNESSTKIVLKEIPQNRPMFLKRQLYMRNRKVQISSSFKCNPLHPPHATVRPHVNKIRPSKVHDPSLFPSIHQRDETKGKFSIEELIEEVESILSALVEQSKETLSKLSVPSQKNRAIDVEKENKKKKKKKRKNGFIKKQKRKLLTKVPASDSSFEETTYQKMNHRLSEHDSRLYNTSVTLLKKQNYLDSTQDKDASHRKLMIDNQRRSRLNSSLSSFLKENYNNDKVHNRTPKNFDRSQGYLNVVREKSKSKQKLLECRRKKNLKASQEQSFTLHELHEENSDEIECLDHYTFYNGKIMFHHSEPILFSKDQRSMNPCITTTDFSRSRSAPFIHSTSSQSYSGESFVEPSNHGAQTLGATKKSGTTLPFDPFSLSSEDTAES